MFIADAHCDTLYSIVCEKMQEDELMASGKNLIAGGVKLQTYALFALSRRIPDTPYEQARKMIEISREIQTPFYTGELPENPPEELHGIFSVEGGEVFEAKIERLHEFHDELRLRMIALTWNYDNPIGQPAKIDTGEGLKPFGKELIREMDRLGIYADVSHLNERGFWEICESMSLPPVATHSNCKELCGCYRNLTRDQIRAIIEKDGFIGINFYPHFLTDDGRNTTLEDVFRHIDYIAQLGGIGVIGLGSDFDGIDEQPEGLRNASDMGNIALCLRKHGYREEDIESIMGMNLWRKLKRAERK